MDEAGPIKEGVPVVHSKNSFDEFFRTEYRQVVGLAYVLTGNWSAAEEVTMDAFTATLKNWDQVRILEAPGAWTRKVVSNAAVSRFRRSKVEARALSRLPDQPDLTGLAYTEVWDAVRRLPRRQRQVIALFYVAGYSRRDVARILDISEESVKTHLERGRRRLQESLKDHG